MSRPYTVLDVFTATALQGNALAVVHDADGLSDEAMLRMARETRLSETAFVQSPDAEGANYRNRIFTIETELPFAGHPSLGVAVAVARRRGERSARYVQQTGAGLQPVEVELDAQGAGGQASMLQEPAVFGPRLDKAKTMAAAGLAPEDAHPELQPQVVSTGIRHVMAPVVSTDALHRAVADELALAALLEPHGAIVLYVAALEDGHVRARGFTPVVAGGEDPATGSAAGPLCAFLSHHTGSDHVEIEQGVEIGRPSLLRAAIEGDRVRVGGDVVVLVDGTVRL
ncbi:MAG: PhzF family phenazine biosynthesis protein [Solirubrobacteraceae bacterium]